MNFKVVILLGLLCVCLAVAHAQEAPADPINFPNLTLAERKLLAENFRSRNLTSAERKLLAEVRAKVKAFTLGLFNKLKENPSPPGN